MKLLLLLCIFLFWVVPANQKWKLSKAMESNLEAKKEQDKLNAECNEYSEAKLKMKNINPNLLKICNQYFILMTNNAGIIFQEISLLWLNKKRKENA